MDSTKLKEIIKMANEAVTDLDGDLKKIAFQTTLDKLLSQNISPAVQGDRIPTNKSKKTRKVVESGSTGKRTEGDSVVKDVLGKMNRTKYSKINDLSTTLDKALYLLLVIRDDLKIDGLNPTQIASILREVFRIKVTKNAVSMALGKDSKYTDRISSVVNGAKAYVYKIMSEGEKYINGKIAEIK